MKIMIMITQQHFCIVLFPDCSMSVCWIIFFLKSFDSGFGFAKMAFKDQRQKLVEVGQPTAQNACLPLSPSLPTPTLPGS